MTCRLECRRMGARIGVAVFMRYEDGPPPPGQQVGALLLTVGQWQLFGAALGLAEGVGRFGEHFRLEVDFPGQGEALALAGADEDKERER